MIVSRPNLGQLMILAGLCAFLTAILGSVTIIDTLKGAAVNMPATLSAFAGVAYTALFGQGVYTLAQNGQAATSATTQAVLDSANRLVNGSGPLPPGSTIPQAAPAPAPPVSVG